MTILLRCKECNGEILCEKDSPAHRDRLCIDCLGTPERPPTDEIILLALQVERWN